ncbi:hypothetical protein GH5_04604 [Leishmania sp. Ghana 2012 LV757]|uniref:Uncharacterized protein n=1 Tax=Leishmania orientalis TaxID=2249476 RepID=A0A836KGV8_9TRYP|nr:hypothetical protein LSCM4_04206 [Leishmania orientalis]KAG5501015.1 hypothetical protein GH5_04604 [Leishmania sp. Ghana 2012 LV757]
MKSLEEQMQQCEAALSSQVEQCCEQGETDPQSSHLTLALVKSTMEALATATPVPELSESIVSTLSSLLECCGPGETLLLRIVTQFLADMALNEANGAMFLRFGIPSCYLLVLQEWSALTRDTLCAVFDFLSTISSSSAQSRRTLRPCIPYVLSAVERHLYEMDILFGGAVTLSTLTTMDDKNCELVAQRGGVQILIGAFYHAHRMETTVQNVARKKSLQSSSALLARTQARRLEEKTVLCRDVQKWCRDVLLKVCRTRSQAVQAVLQQADFGAYGCCIPLDELKWSLMLGQKN